MGTWIIQLLGVVSVDGATCIQTQAGYLTLEARQWHLYLQLAVPSK
jgi:hypothetical protein